MNNPRPWQASALRTLVGGSRQATHRIFRYLPATRRCKTCSVPTQGPFSVPFQVIRIRPSRKNPNMCTM